MTYDTQNKGRAFRRLKSGIEYHCLDKEFDGYVKMLTLTVKRGTDRKKCGQYFKDFMKKVYEVFPYFHYFGVFVPECNEGGKDGNGVESHWHLIVFNSGYFDTKYFEPIWEQITKGSYIMTCKSGGYFWQKGYSAFFLTRYVMNQYVLEQDHENLKVQFRKSRDWLPRDSEYRWKFLMYLFPNDHYNHFRYVKKYWLAYLRGYAWGIVEIKGKDGKVKSIDMNEEYQEFYRIRFQRNERKKKKGKLDQEYYDRFDMRYKKRSYLQSTIVDKTEAPP